MPQTRPQYIFERMIIGQFPEKFFTNLKDNGEKVRDWMLCLLVYEVHIWS